MRLKPKQIDVTGQPDGRVLTVDTGTNRAVWAPPSGGGSAVGVALAEPVADLTGSTDIASTNGSRDFTSATATWEAGQYVAIRGAGAAGGVYLGQIASVAGTTATMTAASPTAGTSASGLTGHYGTDDTVAWQDALRSAEFGETVDYLPAFRSLIRARVATCGTTNGNSTVTCATIAADDVGKWVEGAGIPVGSFIASVTPGVSFTLENVLGAAVTATATAASVGLDIGGLYVPNGVKLLPEGRGPFDPGSDPARNTWGPTFGLIESGTIHQLGGTCSNPHIGLTHASGLGDVLLCSISQVGRTATAPTAAPAQWGMLSWNGAGTTGSVAGVRVGKVMCLNSYWAGSVQGGRHSIDHVKVGAMPFGVIVDHSYDYLEIGVIEHHPYWSIIEGATFPTAGTLDAYALTTSIPLYVLRSDAFHLGRLAAFGCLQGIGMDDSADTAQSPYDDGYGHIDSLDVDTCAYGIAVSHNNATGGGLHVGKANIGANGTGVGTAGQAAVATFTSDAVVVIGEWAHRGTWAAGTSGKSVSSGSKVLTPGTNPGGHAHARAKATRTAGAVTINSNAYMTVHTGLDLVVDAAVGDELEISPSALWDVASAFATTLWTAVDAVTLTAADAIVNYVSGNGSAGLGVTGWFVMPGSLIPTTGKYLYTVQAADLRADGTVKLRLIAKNALNAPTTRAVRASTVDRLQFSVVNLGQ